MFADYIHYLWHSHNRHGVHSPFIYELNEQVLNKRCSKEELVTINKYRRFLKNSAITIEYMELGAGKNKGTISHKKISEIYRKSCSNKRFGEILFQIVRFYKFKNILEIGTCLGVGAAYLHSGAVKDYHFNSIEGNASLINFTSSNFNSYFPQNEVKFMDGNFDEVLPALLSNRTLLDLVFMDGNHSYDATLRYFKLLLNHLHNDSMVIIDDINWSEEMKKVWVDIKKMPEVKGSVDLFRWGILIFKKEIQKEDFTIRFDGFLEAHIG